MRWSASTPELATAKLARAVRQHAVWSLRLIDPRGLAVWHQRVFEHKGLRSLLRALADLQHKELLRQRQSARASRTCVSAHLGARNAIIAMRIMTHPALPDALADANARRTVGDL